MVASVSPPYTNADWMLGYQSLHTEGEYWIEATDGSIPPNLTGTLFRNGPGQLDINGHRYGHPFDGDGMISAFTFKEGRIHYLNRFVRTPEFIAEQKAQKILYRGVFGTMKPGGWLANIFDLNFKNPANTHIIYHGGKLLALWEAARPYRMDPLTLETLGTETFNGSLAKGQSFTAHPKFDPNTGDLKAFGVQTGPSSKLSLFSITPQGQFSETTYTIPGFAFLHDFVWMPNYSLFFQNPVSFNPLPPLLGLKTAGEALQLDPNAPTRIIGCHQSGQFFTIEADPGFIFHFANGYEDPRGHLIVDLIAYDTFPPLGTGDYREVDFASVPPGKLIRYSLDPEHNTVSRQVLLDDRSVEFPVVHPSKVGGAHRYIYMATIHAPGPNAPLQGLLKFDTVTGSYETYSFAPIGYVNEPIVVPVPGSTEEDDVWVLMVVFDAKQQRSFLAIFEGSGITQGPIATAYLEHHIPYGLHGMFTPEVFRSFG